LLEKERKMGVTIHPLRLGVDHCYLLQGGSIIMIDGGAPSQANRFLKALESLSIRPGDIRLLLLTHAHWDHIGSARAIKELTGAPLALHRQEKAWLEKSLTPLPPGVTTWGRIVAGLMSLYMPLVHIPATGVDMVLGDTETSLAEYGIPGQIIYTPGHSMGSVSVLLESAEAFVGDLAMSEFPLRLRPGLPIFADNMGQVRESWKVLLDRGAKIVYPAHGKPFSAHLIQKALVQ
jgi:hydroxyacylglutathione hydrolase